MDTNTGAPANNDFGSMFGPEPTPAAPPVAAPNPELAPVTPPVTPDPNAALAPQPQPAPVAQPPASQPEPQRQDPNTVPLPVLLEQRHRAQAAVARAEAAERMLQQAMGALQQYQRPPQPQPIDPVAEPERAYQALVADAQHREQALRNEFAQHLQVMEQRSFNNELNRSERAARSAYGEETVDKALQAALTQGVNQMFLNQPDPYAALIQWHRAQELATEIGTDPAAYRARIAQQERERVIAEMRQGRQPPAIPPSIAAAPNGASAPEMVVGSGDFFKQMANEPLRRRQ